MWRHPIVLPTMYVLVGMVPPPCAAGYVCAGGCGVTLVLPAMYVLVCVVPPPCVAAMQVLVVVVPLPCVARYVCAGWCGATPLCCPLRMCSLPPRIGRYVYAY